MNFTEFYNNTYKYIYIFFCNRIENKSDIDDLCQETYLRYLNKKKDNFEEKDIKILFGYAKNILHEKVRNLSKEKSSEYIEEYDYSKYLLENNSDKKKQTKLKQIIEALKQLHPNTRKVIEFRFFYKMTAKEVAFLLEMREDQVYKYQNRGIKYLKNIILEN